MDTMQIRMNANMDFIVVFEINGKYKTIIAKKNELINMRGVFERVGWKNKTQLGCTERDREIAKIQTQDETV